MAPEPEPGPSEPESSPPPHSPSPHSPSPPPSTLPLPSPSTLPSPNRPPLSPAPSAWPGCVEDDFLGDLDHNGRSTLGDAVYISTKRLEFGLTGINSVACLLGDFDGDGTFTLNDAAMVAQAQFDRSSFPWDVDSDRRP